MRIVQNGLKKSSFKRVLKLTRIENNTDQRKIYFSDLILFYHSKLSAVYGDEICFHIHEHVFLVSTLVFVKLADFFLVINLVPYLAYAYMKITTKFEVFFPTQ